MDLGLAGSKAVVTGGSKGMGLAIAQTLAAEGASVAVMAREKAALDSAVESLRAVGAPEAVGISVDMSDADSIAAGFAQVSQRWGQLNSLVHTIGPGDGYFEEMNDADWETAFDSAQCRVCDPFARPCRCCVPPSGRASLRCRLTLFSGRAHESSPTRPPRRLSPASPRTLKSLAKDGILVNCVCPGTIVTASFTENLKDILAADGLDASNPVHVMKWIEDNFHHPCDLGRAGLPEEIASITTYLASRRNGYVTGATVNVDGGSDFI